MPKIIRFHEFGSADILQFEDVDLPECPPGHVRIKVRAIGLNRAEASYRAGHFGTPPFPSTIGFEAAGIVLAVAEDVTAFAAGDAVAVIPGLMMHEYGTYAEEICFPAEMLAPIPAGTSMEKAAASWMQFLTAYALISVGRINAGDFILITAASSSVGLAAIQIANSRGAIPIAVTRTNAKRDALIAHGAAHIILSENEDIAERVLAITGGKGAEIMFDAVGGPTLPPLIDALAYRGTIILYGTLAGPVVSLPLVEGMNKGATLRCFSIRDILADPDERHRAIAFIQDGIASGALDARIDRSFDFAAMREAHVYLEGNMQFGKIVVTVP